MGRAHQVVQLDTQKFLWDHQNCFAFFSLKPLYLNKVISSPTEQNESWQFTLRNIVTRDWRDQHFSVETIYWDLLYWYQYWYWYNIKSLNQSLISTVLMMPHEKLRFWQAPKYYWERLSACSMKIFVQAYFSHMTNKPPIVLFQWQNKLASDTQLMKWFRTSFVNWSCQALKHLCW